MTYNEYKSICNMIDNAVSTQRRTNKYGESYSVNSISGNDIFQLKQNIKTLLNNEGGGRPPISYSAKKSIAVDTLKSYLKYADGRYSEYDSDFDYYTEKAVMSFIKYRL